MLTQVTRMRPSLLSSDSDLLPIGWDDSGGPILLALAGEHRGQVWLEDTNDARPGDSNPRVEWVKRRDMKKLADSFEQFLRSLQQLCNEALASRMHPIGEEAARKRREVREQCAEKWAEYAARSGIIVAPPPRITDEQIRRLQKIADLEGDTVLVSVCNRALRSTEARRACEVAWRARKLTPVLLAVALVATLALLLASAGCGEVEAIGDRAVPVPVVDVEGEP